jgi:arabinofuranosyltransferase
MPDNAATPLKAVESRRQWIDYAIKIALVGVIILFAVVVYRCAWLCDDAYITFRTIDNFTHGYGLTWNIVERVQAFTHPLWLFLLSAIYFFTNNIALTALYVSIALAVIGVIVLAAYARSSGAAVVGIILLILSKAYIDFSSSGLENPLTHLLLIVFFIIYLKAKPSVRHSAWLSLIAAVIALNRLDMILLIGPALAFYLWRTHRPKAIGAVVFGMIPLILWEIFSLFYYGSLLPNSAIAKLDTGISAGHLIAQGADYFASSIWIDYITLPVIVVGIVIALLDRNKPGYFIAGGIVLYLLYILRVGGDFMVGRFFSAPLIGAVIILVVPPTIILAGKRYLAVLVFVPLGLASSLSPIYSGADYGQTENFRNIELFGGVADERGFYYSTSKLLKRDENQLMPWAAEGIAAAKSNLRIYAKQSTGYFGFYAGPDVYVIDEMGLGDPLLSRLPAMQLPKMRIGHYRRKMPDDYYETIRTGQNHLKDSSLAAYYAKIVYITRGNLWKWNRIVEAMKFNLGWYDDYRDAYVRSLIPYQDRPMQTVEFSKINRSRPTGWPWNGPGNILFTSSGLVVDLGNATDADRIMACIDKFGVYHVEFYRDSDLVGSSTLTPPQTAAGMITARIYVPKEAIASRYDRIKLIPQKDDYYSLGSLTLMETGSTGP